MSIGFRNNSRKPGIWRRLAAVLTVLTLAAVAAGWHFIGRWTPSRGEFPSQGISVSANQGDIDWGSVRTQNIDFAYIRAVDGGIFADPAFAKNWSEAGQAGLRYGAELEFDACRTAADQATRFITTVPRDNAALPPAIRLDMPKRCAAGRDRILSELNTLINLVETHSGKPALLRVTEAFEEKYHVSRDINRTLWVEGNFLRPSYVSRSWVMWTANSFRRINGIDGAVEWDVVAQ